MSIAIALLTLLWITIAMRLFQRIEGTTGLWELPRSNFYELWAGTLPVLTGSCGILANWLCGHLRHTRRSTPDTIDAMLSIVAHACVWATMVVVAWKATGNLRP
jgi:hypothetical protein